MPRKKRETPIMEEVVEDFIVKGAAPSTGSSEKSNQLSSDEWAENLLKEAISTYDYDKKQSSAFLNETGSYNSPTLDEIGQLAEGAQDNLTKILRINSIINKYSNIDDVIGLVINAISTNLNDEYRLSYKNVDGRNKNKKAERAKELIDKFNEEVGIDRVIREQIPRAYMEGTVVMYLRKDEDTWTIDTYPLGVSLVSPYKVGGEPTILIDITELKNRIQKSLPKTRGGKDLFYKTMDEEIKANFPAEIYDGFKNKETQIKLNVKYTGVLRIGSNGRKYGVSPIFRSLPSSIILETFLKSDMLNAKARAKKMIVQIMNKELLGTDGSKNPLTQQAFSHKELITACNKSNVLYTAPAYVSDVKVVEPKGDMIGKDTIYYYLNKQMSTLGVGFLSLQGGNNSVSSASISLAQLMRNINAISSELENIIKKFYKQILIDESLPPEYAPDIQIIDSEALEFELKTKLVELLYSKLNCSLKTALEVVGYDVNEELRRRKEENEGGYSEIFIPRQTSYTSNGDTEKTPGRPSGEDNNKTQYDQEYNKEART